MRNIFILFLFVLFSSCSNSQTKNISKDSSETNGIDYSKEILGCWKFYDAKYEIESNYSFIDSLLLVDKQNLIDEIKKNSFVTKFFKNMMNEYDKNGIPDENPATYYIQNDSIFIRGTFRQDKSSGKISIINDTLYLQENASKEFKKFLLDLKWDYKMDIPKDIKLEKMIRHAILIRVQNCDQYRE
jgi:hypothetical protein